MILVVKEFFKFISILVIATFATFVMLYDTPDNVAENLLIMHDMVPTKEAIENIKKEQGLDRPFMTQYLQWVKNAAKGDFGYSHSMGRAVNQEFVRRMPSTLILAGYAIMLLGLFSLLFGILASVYRGRLIDKIITMFSSAVIAMPVFWMGLLLILIFIVNLHLFELTKMYKAQNLILPSIALALPLIGRYTILIRAAFIEQLSSDYVIGAKVRGVPQKDIILKHILPNAIVVILPPLGISIGAILGGTIIIETIFGIYGLGNMVLSGIDHGDYPLIKTFVLFMTAIYMSVSFVTDWACRLIDPRLRHKS